MNRLYNNLKPKGKNEQTDEEIVQEVYQLFREDNKGNPFKYNESWKVLSHSPK